MVDLDTLLEAYMHAHNNAWYVLLCRSSRPLPKERHKRWQLRKAVAATRAYMFTEVVRACSSDPCMDRFKALCRIHALGKRFCMPSLVQYSQKHSREAAEWKLRDTAARIIQQRFREAISNPEYNLCKRRLCREFNADLKPSMLSTK